MMYTVGEMAKLLGVPASTLRYYDKEGLLPFVERSSGGMRVFRERDYEWLRTIECMKKTGMPLKDIRTYIEMAMEGDRTVEPRLGLLSRQREAVREQIAQLRETLDMLDFKCWYYEMALERGSTQAVRDMPPEEVPERFRASMLALAERTDGKT